MDTDSSDNAKYIQWLKKTDSTIETYVTNNTTDISTDTVTFKLESVPNVPKDARLILVKDLMNDFKTGQSPSSEIKYFNLLNGSISDVHINNCFMNVVNAGRLPKQYFYVLGHANPDILIGYKTNGKYNHYYSKTDVTSLWQLLKDMRSKGYTDGQTVAFLACQAGNKLEPIAEKFSKLEGVGTVYAFTALGWFGVPFYTAARFKSSNESVRKSFSADRVYGHWRIFNTAATAKIKPPAPPKPKPKT